MQAEERSKLANKILEGLLKEGGEFKSNRLTYKKLPYNIRKKMWLDRAIDKSFFKNYDLMDFLLLSDEYKVMIEESVVELAKGLEGKERDERIQELESDVELPMYRIDRDALIPIFNIESEKEEVIMFDMNTNRISEVSYQSWLRGLGEERGTYLNTRFRDAKFVYDPYNIQPFKMDETLEVNLYIPPKWRLDEVEDPHLIKCPKLVRDFFQHLFPDDEQRALAFHWCHIALTGRNEAALTLVAHKGIGKGILHELLSAVVGQENSDIVPESFFRSDFNSILLNRRLLLVDEKRVGKAEHTRLKRYMNDTQNIEKKGVDVRNKQRTYNNFIIACNDVSDMYLEFDDRRFTVLEPTTTPLLHFWDESKIDEFSRLIREDEEMIRDFGYWLLYHGKMEGRGETEVFKGPRFYEIVYNSLREWQKFILDKVIEEGRKYYPIRHLRKDFKKEVGEKSRIPSTTKIDDFLKNYLHLGEYPIGKIGESDEGPAIYVNEYFVKEDLDFFGDEEDDEDFL